MRERDVRCAAVASAVSINADIALDTKRFARVRPFQSWMREPESLIVYTSGETEQRPRQQCECTAT